MKRALSLLLSLSLALLLVSCGKPLQNAPKQDADAENGNLESTVPSGTDNFGIVADSIRAYYSPDVNYEVFVLERDGKFGVIDHKGNVLVEPKFDFASLAHTATCDSEWKDAEIKILLSNKTEHSTDSMKGFFVEADGTLTEGSCDGGGFHYCQIYWDVTQNTPLVFDDWDGHCDFLGTSTDDFFANPISHTYYRAVERPRMVPVQAVSSYTIQTEDPDGSSWENLSVTVEKDGLYALLSLETGKLLTDFVYEDYDRQGEVNHIIAMKKNGSWGYVSTLGAEISRFGFLPCYTETIWGKNGWEEVAAFYPNTRTNLITFCEGELYGVMDASEARVYVVPAFTDATLPNSSGWFYAQTADGTWRAINAFDNYREMMAQNKR